MGKNSLIQPTERFTTHISRTFLAVKYSKGYFSHCCPWLSSHLVGGRTFQNGGSPTFWANWANSEIFLFLCCINFNMTAFTTSLFISLSTSIITSFNSASKATLIITPISCTEKFVKDIYAPVELYRIVFFRLKSSECIMFSSLATWCRWKSKQLFWPWIMVIYHVVHIYFVLQSIQMFMIIHV